MVSTASFGRLFIYAAHIALLSDVLYFLVIFNNTSLDIVQSCFIPYHSKQLYLSPCCQSVTKHLFLLQSLPIMSYGSLLSFGPFYPLSVHRP